VPPGKAKYLPSVSNKGPTFQKCRPFGFYAAQASLALTAKTVCDMSESAPHSAIFGAQNAWGNKEESLSLWL
jgi:hypothetical protein